MKTQRIAIPLALALAVALPAGAVAAPKAGAYSGASSTTIGTPTPDGTIETKTYVGKVTFKVAGNKVTGFAMKGQKVQCGPGPVPILLKLPSITLNSGGSGTGAKTDPTFGPFTVKVKASGAGKATGTITFVACSSTVKFTAKTS